MAVDCILRKTFIDRIVTAAVSQQRKVHFYPASAETFLGAKQPSATKADWDANRTRAVAVNDLLKAQKTLMIRAVTNSPMTQVTARVSTPAAGVCFLKNHWRPRSTVQWKRPLSFSTFQSHPSGLVMTRGTSQRRDTAATETCDSYNSNKLLLVI